MDDGAVTQLRLNSALPTKKPSRRSPLMPGAIRENAVRVLSNTVPATSPANSSPGS